MRFYFAYIFLLLYVIAALTFWWFSLEKLSDKITNQEIKILQTHLDTAKQPILYHNALLLIEAKEKKRTAQYAGEGATFLIITLIGAAMVYSSYRRSTRLSRQQNNFMLAVTHELKSPIAGIKLGLQTVQKHKLTAEQTDTVLKRTIQEANRLDELFTNMLIASQMEGRHYKSHFEEMNFSDFIRHEVSVFQSRFPERVQSKIEEEVTITGDQLLLQLAFNNVLDNALKYSPADTVVHVHLTQTKNEVTLKIIDQGPGIPDHLKSKVFQKFYRLEPEETRRTKGTGLGLYLSKRILSQHKGQLTLENNQPKGCIFTLKLPAILSS